MVPHDAHALFAGRPSNILEWHFVISGPTDSPYEGGQYHGKLVFPSEYPYKPPAIMMLTPKCGAAPVCLCSCVSACLCASEHCVKLKYLLSSL